MAGLKFIRSTSAFNFLGPVSIDISYIEKPFVVIIAARRMSASGFNTAIMVIQRAGVSSVVTDGDTTYVKEYGTARGGIKYEFSQLDRVQFPACS